MCHNRSTESGDGSMEKERFSCICIGLNVEDEQLLIRSTKTAKSAWDSLQMYYEKSNANSLVRLIKHFMSMKLDESAELEMYIAQPKRFNNCMTSIKS